MRISCIEGYKNHSYKDQDSYLCRRCGFEDKVRFDQIKKRKSQECSIDVGELRRIDLIRMIYKRRKREEGIKAKEA